MERKEFRMLKKTSHTFEQDHEDINYHPVL